MTALWAPVRAQELQDDLASALRVIKPIVREDPRRAILMLERLDEQYPGHARVLLLLGDTYQHVGELDKARAAYERCLQAHPVHLQAGAALGALYIHMGQRDKGLAVFNNLLAQAGHSVAAYRTIGSVLSRRGHYDMALETYRQGREHNAGNFILTFDIAYLEKSMGNYEGSLREYLSLVEKEPGQRRLARTKILELLRDPTADRAELTGILRTTAEAPGAHPEVLSVLATVYLEQGMLESALEMALEAEQRGGSDGQVLFNLAELTIGEYQRPRNPEKAAYFNLALRAIEAFLEGYPDSKQLPRAKLMLIDLLVDLAAGRVTAPATTDVEGTIDRALEALDWLIESFPNTEWAEQAYLKKGDVVLNLQKDAVQAKDLFEKGARTARTYRTMFAERLGRVYLILDEYDKAESHLTRLVRTHSGELAETGVFYSGLMLSFKGQYEAARDTLTALAEGNPSSQFTNDAIELAWIIEEGLQGDKTMLEHFLAAIKLELAADTTGIIAELRPISRSPVETPLRSRALIKLGDTYVASRQYDRALETFETFVADYPGEILLPDVHRRIGQVYEYGYGKKRLALRKYESILMLYPYYIFLDEVRSDVNRLRRDLDGRADA